MLKKPLALFLSLMLLFAVIPAAVFAIDEDGQTPDETESLVSEEPEEPSVDEVITSEDQEITPPETNYTVYEPNKLPATGIKNTAIEVRTVAEGQTVTSSNNNVITITENKIINFVGKGKATVKVTYTLPNAKKATVISKAITVISKVDGISLDKDAATIARKQKTTLKATISPADATNTTVVWSVSPKGIATVTNKGVVTGVKGGTCTVRATSKDGGQFAEATITVTPIFETSIKLNKKAVNLAKGKTFQPKVTFVPSTTDDKTITWEVLDNSNIVTVDTKGKITASNTPGTCTVRATSVTGKTADCTVTVLPQKVTSVKFGATPATVNAGSDLNMGEKLIVAPANADNRTVTWSSSNSNVASVDENGIVTFKAGGKVTIKATANDGSKKSASKAFTVKQLVEDVVITNSVSELTPYMYYVYDLDAWTLCLQKGKTFQVKTSVLPATATNKTLKWTSSNSKIASVSAKGAIKGVSKGVVDIKIATTDGSGLWGYFPFPILVYNSKVEDGYGNTIFYDYDGKEIKATSIGSESAIKSITSAKSITNIK